MAFRKKAKFILPYKPDILVVPECEHPDKLKFTEGTPQPSSSLWFGRNPHKGLGIFSYGKFKFEVLDVHDPDLKTIVPVLVKKGRSKFTLLAIWAYNPEDLNFQYVGQVWKSLHHYDRLILNKRTILAGDFNSNTIWDKARRTDNHSDVVRHLEQRGIYSTYHRYHNQKQGSEKHPTLYMYRHKDKAYHIDYCFASTDFIRKLKSVEIGKFESWRQHSDHVPVIVRFDS